MPDASSTLAGNQAGTPAHFGKPKPDCVTCQGTGFDLTMTVWIGGDPACAHGTSRSNNDATERKGANLSFRSERYQCQGALTSDQLKCKCGAERVNCQLGSERVPDCGQLKDMGNGLLKRWNCADDSVGGDWKSACHICRMVLVFREARRVLRDDGTCWINYGDTYASGGENRQGKSSNSINPNTPKCAAKHGMGHVPSSTKRESRTADTVSDAVKGYDGVYARKVDRQSNNGTFAIETSTGLAPGNLIGVPWRIALALQADGWILRSDLPWCKLNAMPESCETRPGKALEYMFQFCKSMGAFFDMDAMRVQSKQKWCGTDFIPDSDKDIAAHGKKTAATGASFNNRTDEEMSQRNFRNADLWFESINSPHGIVGIGDELVGLDVVSQPYSKAHYATFPNRLIEPLIKCSTSEAGCCDRCGTPWRRVLTAASGGAIGSAWLDHDNDAERGGFKTADSKGYKTGTTLYWEPGCTCHGRTGNPERVPCTVLDIFMGSGTTAEVSIGLGRRSWGIEISLRYLEGHQVERVTNALKERPTLHDQIVERPREVFTQKAVKLPPKKKPTNGPTINEPL